jgi:hypothetical protein
MRSSLYARTSPEARPGFAVFAVRLVFDFMARQRLWAVWTGVNDFEQDRHPEKVAKSPQRG